MSYTKGRGLTWISPHISLATRLLYRRMKQRMQTLVEVIGLILVQNDRLGVRFHVR
jgi:hypothetical protein